MPVTDLKAETKAHTYDPQSAPPPFGHALFKYFAFDPAYVNLNHGSYGSLPLPVKTYVDQLENEAEANPDLWYRFTYQPRLTAVRAQVAQLIGARADECVMVQNTSVGLNTVLREFDWREGDIIVGAMTTYGSVTKTISYLNDVHPGIKVAPFPLRFPTSHGDMLTSFRHHLRSLQRPEASTSNPEPKVVAVIDAIVSNPGALLPWEEMVKICREENVWSVVNAAHCIGQQVGINLSQSKPDFWVSNCHKWLYAKRSCAVLYVAERNRHIIRSSFPTSHDYKRSPTVKEWQDQFDWNSTIDFVPYLSIKAALEFRHWLGGEEKINAYCHALAMQGGARLAEILGTQMMGRSDEITLNMVNVELPLPRHTKEHHSYIEGALEARLLQRSNCFAAFYYHDDRWWMRASAQVWNELSDFEIVGKVFLAACQDFAAEISGSVELGMNRGCD